MSADLKNKIDNRFSKKLSRKGWNITTGWTEKLKLKGRIYGATYRGTLSPEKFPNYKFSGAD